MPLTPGAPVGETIKELRGGKTFAHTLGKFGPERARKQAIAIALSNSRKASGGVVPTFDDGGGVNPVQAIISALQQGSGAGAGSTGAPSPAVPGASNPAAPSSAVATALTNATNTVGVAPGTQSTNPLMPNAATTAASTVGTAQSQPVRPMGTQLLRRGGVANRQMGGLNVSRPPSMNPPWFERNEARQLHVGPVVSSVPGRTDAHQIKVPAGSYVVPSSTVSSLGHGNSLAGMNLLGKMYHMGPYGMGPTPHMPHGNLPRPPRAFTKFAIGGGLFTYSEGGARGAGHYEAVPVDVSGGEVIVPPWAIIQKHGSLKLGHAALDNFVMSQRKKEIGTLRKLPPPAKK